MKVSWCLEIIVTLVPIVGSYSLDLVFKSNRARLQKSHETGNRENVSLEKVLEPKEIGNAEMYWVREINRKRFSEELTTVRGGGSVLTNSPL